MVTNEIIYTLNKNRMFLKYILKACELTDNPVSVVPSILFLIFSFFFFHGVLHRRTSLHTPFKIYIYRELGFQWTFFYLARMWILCVKSTRWIARWLENYVKVLHSRNEAIWLSPVQVRATVFSILTSVSLIPLGIVIATCLYQQTIPNFLMWVGEDPWLRSEIGISGHYLERPLSFVPPKRKEYAYRSRRSASVENAFDKLSDAPLRNCKSLQGLK